MIVSIAGGMLEPKRSNGEGQATGGVRDNVKMLQGIAMNLGEPLQFQKESGNKSINDKLLQEVMQRQSDCSVVARKPCNDGGAKGGRHLPANIGTHLFGL